MQNKTEVLGTTAGLAAGVLASPFDGGALIGSFAGSALYAINVKEPSVKKRLLNMGVSMLAGYIGKDFIADKLGADTMVGALIASAVIVVAFGWFLDQADKMDIFERFKR